MKDCPVCDVSMRKLEPDDYYLCDVCDGVFKLVRPHGAKEYFYRIRE